MNDNTIYYILMLLKINPLKFCEKDYDKETIEYLKEVIESADRLYGDEDSFYLRNKYYRYLYDYCFENIGLRNDLEELRKIVFGFFYKTRPYNLTQTLYHAKELLSNSFQKIDELHQEKTEEKLYELLNEDGIAFLSMFILHSLAVEDASNPMISLLAMNTCIANELRESRKEDKVSLDDAIKRVKLLSKRVDSRDPFIFEMLYCLTLSKFCDEQKILRLNPFYNKAKKTGRCLNNVNIADLENEANEYRNGYFKEYSIPVNEAIEDIENLQLLSKNSDDYSLYDCLIYLTNISLNKIRKKNNIVLENTLLENLYITRLLLETKMENESKKSKIKKLL